MGAIVTFTRSLCWTPRDLKSYGGKEGSQVIIEGMTTVPRQGPMHCHHLTGPMGHHQKRRIVASPHEILRVQPLRDVLRVCRPLDR